MRTSPLFGVSFSHKLTCFYCGCSRLSNQLKGSFYLINCPSTSVSMEGVLQGRPAFILDVPSSPSPHSNISKTVFQSLRNITTKSFPCCSPSTRGNFLTMSPEDGGCKTAFQTRQLLFTKRFKDSITFPPQTSTGTICWCMSCVSLPLEGGECWYTITCRQQRKILDAFCSSDRHIYFPMHHLPDRCKDVGEPGIRINEWLCLHDIFWFVWILFLARHKGQYMENLILTTTFSGPPTLLHLPHKFTNVKKPKPGFVLTRDAKWLKCVTFFPVSVCTFILFLHQDFQGKQHWLIYGHFQTLCAGVSLGTQASVIRPAWAPPSHEPRARQLSVKTRTPKHVGKFRTTISTTFCLETMTVFEKFFKCTNVIIRSKHFWNRIGVILPTWG